MTNSRNRHLNLLVTLDVLWAEWNVTPAAQLLCLFTVLCQRSLAKPKDIV